MINSLYLANQQKTRVLTLRDDLPLTNISEYLSQFTLCDNVLITRENSLDILKAGKGANISITAGIYNYETDGFGNVSKLSEFYKTHETSDQLQTNIIYNAKEAKNRIIESVWNRRHDLHGALFTAISS